MAKLRKFKENPIDSKKAATLAMSDLEQALGYLLSMAQQYAFRDFQLHFDSVGLTPNLYSVLVLIDAKPGCRQTDLGATLGVLQTNLVERIDSLVDRGLVRREEHKEDRRAKALILTEGGVDFVRRIREIHARMTEDYARSFGEAEYGQLIGLLQKLIDREQRL